MLKNFLRVAAAIMILVTVSFSAKAHTENNLTYEKKIVTSSLENMMKYKVRTGNFIDNDIEGQTGLLGGSVEATARFMDHNGGVCTVTLHKELLFLGYPGDSKISKQCKITGKKSTV